MAKGDFLQPHHHFSRYCSPSRVGDDELPLVTAFELGPQEDHLSVNWLEYFGLNDMDACMKEVRQAFIDKGYALRPSGKFAILMVSKAIDTVRLGAGVDLRILHWPENDDASHSGIFDYSSEDLQVALDLKSLVTPNDVHSALV